VSSSAKPKKSLAETLAASSAPPAAMTRSVQLKVQEVQRALREKQEAERRRAEKDEEFRAYIKRSTAKFAPLVAAKEAERLATQRPLIWQCDPIAARNTDTQRQAREQARRFSAQMRELTTRAGAGRVPLFINSGVDQVKEAAAHAALEKVAETARRHGASMRDVLNEDERELLGATARAQNAGATLRRPSTSGGKRGDGPTATWGDVAEAESSSRRDAE
jgi:hypothetical protein